MVKGKTRPYKELRNQIYPGDDAFIEALQALVGEGVELSEVPSVQKRRLAKPIKKYIEPAGSRNEGIYLAYRSGG